MEQNHFIYSFLLKVCLTSDTNIDGPEVNFIVSFITLTILTTILTAFFMHHFSLKQLTS
jgi:hypothetical protein